MRITSRSFVTYHPLFDPWKSCWEKSPKLHWKVFQVSLWKIDCNPTVWCTGMSRISWLPILCHLLRAESGSYNYLKYVTVYNSLNGSSVPFSIYIGKIYWRGSEWKKWDQKIRRFVQTWDVCFVRRNLPHKTVYLIKIMICSNWRHGDR